VTQIDHADPIPFTAPANHGQGWFFVARITPPYGEPAIIGGPIRGAGAARTKAQRLHRATGETYVLCPVLADPDTADAPAGGAA